MSPRSRTRLWAAAWIALGLGITAANLDLPIVRNAHVYAKTSYHLIDSGFDLGRVTRVPSLSFGKPSFFPLLATPWVAGFGAQVGIPLTSALGMVAYLVAALAFLRRVGPRLGLGEPALPLALLLLFGNPLAIYQFWSGYPDGLFAGMAIASFAAWDRLVRDGGRRRDALLWAAATYLAIATKHYGLILLPLHAVYALGQGRPALRRLLGDRRRRTWLLALLALLAAALLLALLGHNPTLHLGARSSGADNLWRSLLRARPPWLGHGVEVLAFLALGLSPLFPLALYRVNARRELAVFAAVPLLFAAPLFAVPSSVNLRYYLPVAPFAALFVCRGLLALPAPWRRGLVLASAALGALGVVFFNVEAAHRALRPHAPAWVWHKQLENLRMARHLERRALFRDVNRLEPGAVVHFVSSYYGTAVHGVDERSGWFRPDLRLAYHRRPPRVDEVVAGHHYWVRDPKQRAALLRELLARGARVEPRGRLLRVEALRPSS